MYKILISDKLPDSALELIQQENDFDVVVHTGLTEDQLCAVIPEFHAIIVRSATKVTQKVIDCADNLKVIGRAGSGLDNIDTEYAKKRGIGVLNTPGTNSQAVAELTIGYLFTLSRKLYSAHASMKSHKWEKSKFGGVEVSGKTIGLIGFGQIGQKVGKMASALGMKVLVYKRTPVRHSPAFEFELVDFDYLLSRSDYISLHLPKTAESANLIGYNEFCKMKPDAFFINCARGGIVNEADLIRALDENKIAGAGIDVFADEPATNINLLDHEKVVATPHIGASTAESQERVGQSIVNAVIDYLKSKYLFINGNEQ